MPADLARVDALLARSYPRLLAGDYPPSIMVTAVPLIARANPKLLASGRYFVAETEEEAIVAAGGWSTEAPTDQRTGAAAGPGHVRHVVTDHRLIRRGIGRRLMAAVLADAGSAGIPCLDCLSTRTAVPFYAALGFDLLGLVEVQLRPGIGFPALHMRCQL